MNFTTLIQKTIKKLGKQEQLAIALDLAPSALSRRLNGEIGWQEAEINQLLKIANCEIAEDGEDKKKIKILTDAIKVIVSIE